MVPASTYLPKINNRNTRPRREICSKLTIKTQELRHWRRSGVFTVNFGHISHIVLVFLLLTLNSDCWLGLRWMVESSTASKYMLKIRQKNIMLMSLLSWCMCSMLAIKTPERSSNSINLLSLLLPLNNSSRFILSVDF